VHEALDEAVERELIAVARRRDDAVDLAQLAVGELAGHAAVVHEREPLLEAERRVGHVGRVLRVPCQRAGHVREQAIARERSSRG